MSLTTHRTPSAATLPNVEDIGAWLECPEPCIFSFGYEYRPASHS
jgi:hypothetical protein